jgi:hypothetical protein
MMPMTKGGPFGDAFSRKGPDDGFPPMMRGRDFPFPFPISRGPSLTSSMVELQFAQDQAARGFESNPAVVSASASAGADPTPDVGVRSAGPLGQPSPGRSLSSPLGLGMIVDEPAADRGLELASLVVSGRAAANPGRGEVVNAPPLDEAGDSKRSATADDHPEEVLEPHAAGLMARVLPFDQRSLEEAVDQFLDQLHELNAGGFIEPSPIRIIVASAAVIGAGVAVEAGRRRLSPRRRGRLTRAWDANESEELLGFPELPGSWSTRWT